MQNTSSTSAIDAYIAQFPPATQATLGQLRALVHEEAPAAQEKISYRIPAFFLNNKPLVYFAGYAKHIGFYPTGSGIEAFQGELSAYKVSKGTVQFPLGQPLPLDLIRRIVRFRIGEVQKN
jgi:uncharacterized protein YdhG (YjbR/CyaY superfamily)